MVRHCHRLQRRDDALGCLTLAAIAVRASAGWVALTITECPVRQRWRPMWPYSSLHSRTLITNDG